MCIFPSFDGQLLGRIPSNEFGVTALCLHAILTLLVRQLWTQKRSQNCAVEPIRSSVGARRSLRVITFCDYPCRVRSLPILMLGIKRGMEKGRSRKCVVTAIRGKRSVSWSAAVPAPGINGVIASATIEAINCGLRVLGLRDGYRWLAEGDTSHVVELQDRGREPHPLYRWLGPAHLAHQSRRDEASLERVHRALTMLGVRYLVCIGGDDTTYGARKNRRADARRESASRRSPRLSTTTFRCPKMRPPSASKPRALSAPRSSNR